MVSLSAPTTVAILGLSIWLLLISPAHSLECTSQNFTDKKKYEKCVDLPALDSYLHYTYNASNSSLNIAFIAKPASADGWIAWAINPNKTGMGGSQTLLAMKSDGKFVVKTLDIQSYGSITEGKLSFDTWNLKAEAGSDGKMIIFGSVEVPEKAEKINQVWQVGKVADGKYTKHEMQPENLKAVASLDLKAGTLSAPPPSSSSGSLANSPSPSGGKGDQDKASASMININNFDVFLVLFMVVLGFFSS